MTPTIRSNVETVLAALGIHGVVIFEERADRVFAFDTLHQLNDHCFYDCADIDDHWMECNAVNHSLSTLKNTVITSFREKTRPSMQVVFHKRSAVNRTVEQPWSVIAELDIDLAPPNNPINLIRHGAEVIANRLTHGTTDQANAARLLAERFTGASPASKEIPA